MELGFFLVNVFKRAVDGVTPNLPLQKKKFDNTNQVYWLERTISSTFLQSSTKASIEYISKMSDKLLLVKAEIQLANSNQGIYDYKNYNYLIKFISLCENHIINNRTVLPRDVLEVLNVIYKRKGDIVDIYKK